MCEEAAASNTVSKLQIPTVKNESVLHTLGCCFAYWRTEIPYARTWRMFILLFIYLIIHHPSAHSQPLFKETVEVDFNDMQSGTFQSFGKDIKRFMLKFYICFRIF